MRNISGGSFKAVKMAKASKLMYGIIIMLTVMGVLTIFLGQFFVNYGVTIPAAQNETLNLLADSTAIDVYIEEQKQEALSEDEPPSTLLGEALDILGFWFQRGIQTLKLIPKVLTLAETLTTSAITSASGSLGISAIPLRNMIIALLTVFIILGVIVSALLKKDI